MLQLVRPPRKDADNVKKMTEKLPNPVLRALSTWLVLTTMPSQNVEENGERPTLRLEA